MMNIPVHPGPVQPEVHPQPLSTLPRALPLVGAAAAGSYKLPPQTGREQVPLPPLDGLNPGGQRQASVWSVPN